MSRRARSSTCICRPNGRRRLTGSSGGVTSGFRTCSFSVCAASRSISSRRCQSARGCHSKRMASTSMRLASLARVSLRSDSGMPRWPSMPSSFTRSPLENSSSAASDLKPRLVDVSQTAVAVSSASAASRQASVLAARLKTILRARSAGGVPRWPRHRPDRD